MTRLVLMSDLHFGMHRAALLPDLLARVNGAGADLVLIAGDLTHRGRIPQFQEAAAFLAALHAPWIAVPGNHDVPLFELWLRFSRPFRNWRGQVTRDLAPWTDAGAVRVVGINSVDPMAWQRGLIGRRTLDRALDRIDAARPTVVMLHHPLQQLPQVDKEPMRGAPRALAALQDAGAWISFSGHLHIWQAAAFAGRPLLQIQAGTALCDRIGDGQNEFAVLDLNGTDLTVTRHISPMTGPAVFTDIVEERFTRASGVWQPV